MTEWWKGCLRPLVIFFALFYTVALLAYAAGIAVAHFIGGKQ